MEPETAKILLPCHAMGRQAAKLALSITKRYCTSPLNIRHRSSGAVYAWEFGQGGKGQLILNSIVHVLNGALDGIGPAYVPEALADWCSYFQGFHLYYPHRRQASLPLPHLWTRCGTVASAVWAGVRTMKDAMQEARTESHIAGSGWLLTMPGPLRIQRGFPRGVNARFIRRPCHSVLLALQTLALMVPGSFPSAIATIFFCDLA